MEGVSIDPRPFWSLPSEAVGRAEGVSLSRDGRLMAVAHSIDERVTVHERRGDAIAFSDRPVWTIKGPQSGIHYPHDLDFSPDGRLLVVANRNGRSLTCYARLPGDAVRFSSRPLWAIRGRRSRLRQPDGVKFVPPDGAYVAAANLPRSSVTFFRRGWLRRSHYRRRPAFVLEGPATGLVHPDGLSFTDDGSLLAVTNHGGASVTVYARGSGRALYGPAPIAVLGGTPSRLRYPHSVSFAPGGTHLAITNAGGRTVSVYRRGPGADPRSSPWPEPPMLELDACDPDVFERQNSETPKEGGSKGVAFGADCLAVCSPHFGLRVHRVRTAPSTAT